MLELIKVKLYQDHEEVYLIPHHLVNLADYIKDREPDTFDKHFAVYRIYGDSDMIFIARPEDAPNSHLVGANRRWANQVGLQLSELGKSLSMTELILLKALQELDETYNRQGLYGDEKTKLMAEKVKKVLDLLDELEYD